MQYEDGTLIEYNKNGTIGQGIIYHHFLYELNLVRGVIRRPSIRLYAYVKDNVDIFKYELATPLTADQKEELKNYLNSKIGMKCTLLNVFGSIVNKIPFMQEWTGETVAAFDRKFIYGAYKRLGMIQKFEPPGGYTFTNLLYALKNRLGKKEYVRR